MTNKEKIKQILQECPVEDPFDDELVWSEVKRIKCYALKTQGTEMKENAFRSKICREIRSLQGIVIPVVGSARGMSGTPDVFISHILWQGWIEFKGEGTKIAPIQKKVLLDLRKSGTESWIVRYPCLIEEPDGTVVQAFKDALEMMRWMKDNSRRRVL